MKKILLILPLLLLLVGCTNKVEENKIAYLEYKSKLQEQETFTEEESVDFNTFFNIERENEETVKYNMTIDNPNINMHEVKALLIHDSIQDEAYPSVGILDKPLELTKESEDKITLSGTIQTIEEISDVTFKLYLEYKDDDGEKNKIYYQVSRG